MSRFPHFRDELKKARDANDFYRAMFAPDKPPQVVYAPEKPKRASPVRDESRVSEAQVNDVIRGFSASRDDLVLWRNSRGMIDLPGGGKLRYGVGPNGASDWIGYRTVRVTQAMVGSTVAQFVACEAKAPDAGAVPDHQEAFLRAVRAGGGVGFVARNTQDLDDALD